MSIYVKKLIFPAISILFASFFLLTNLEEIFKILLFILFSIFAIAPFYPKVSILLLIFIRPCLDIFTSSPLIETENFNLNFASLQAILLIAFSFIILLKNINKIKTIPLKYNWLIFFTITISSILISYNSFLSLAESLRLLSIFVIYCVTFFLFDSEHDLENIIKTIIASAVIPSFFAIWQLMTETGLTVPYEGIYNRIYGTFAHPNLFAYYLLLPLILSLYLFLRGNGTKVINISFLLFTLYFGTILTLTFTRGAWLSFLIIIAIIGVFRYRVLLISTFIFILLIYTFIEPINYRVNDLISNRSNSSIQWRLNLWNDATKYIKVHPFFGHGTGVSSDLIMNKRGERFGSSDPHNDYLKITIENGVIGLLTYFSLIVGLFINLIRKYFSQDKTRFKILFLILISFAISLFIMSAADNVLRNTALMWSFWALIGAVLAQKKKSISI